MRIHRVRLTDFRGVSDADIELHTAGVTVIEGPNEIGKSSVAEAIGLIRGFHDSSRAKEVVAVKPVGVDAGPQVEIEVTTGDYSFTYRKRFLKRPMTELVVRSPRPEQHSGREADDRVEEIFEQTLDPQLWDALQMVQGASFDQPVLARIEPLRSALGSAAGSDSGQGHQDLLEAIADQNARYFTPMGRPRGDYAALSAELVNLRFEVAELEAEQAGVQERLDRYERNERRLSELGDDETVAVATLSSLTSRHDLLRGLRDRAETQRTEVERAGRDLEAAVGASTTRERLRRDSSTAAAEHDSMVLELAEAEHRLARLQAAAEVAQLFSQETDAEARTARDAHRAAVDRLDRARSSAELALLSDRQASARAMQESIAQAHAHLEVNQVDDDALDAFVAADAALRAAEAARDAAATTVVVQRLGAEPVTVDDLEVPERHEAPVLEPTEIVVPGVACIRVLPGRQRRDLVAAVAEARATWDVLLHQHGIDDLAQARALARERRTREGALHRFEASLADLLGGEDLEVLSTRRLLLLERVGDHEVSDREAISSLELAAEELRDRADVDMERARAATAAAADHEQLARSARETAIRLRQSTQDALTHSTRLREQLTDARAYLPDAELDLAVENATDAVAAAKADLVAVGEALEAKRSDEVVVLLDNAQATVTRFAHDRRQIENEQQQILGQLTDIEARGLRDRQDETAAELEHAERAHEQMQARAAAARLLHTTMQRHLTESKERYVAPFKGAVERLGRIVFGADFAVGIGPDLVIESRTSGGVTVPFASLSGGAKEQLAVIGRLACAQLVSADDGAPVILDDSLGFSDPARLGRLAAVLREVGRTAQIIILTCQPSRFSSIGGAVTVRLPLERSLAS